ncbi:MAG TPA: serine hydrolase [Steroidobacteraceae bacterium]|jgi:CubicO group peptidase (beta-lactamase class C family)|nr:serine hydrolase [Steroidobacteraceae bacterium]
MYLSKRETPSSRHGILRRGFQAAFPAVALLLLAACGGGGGGGNDPPAPPATNNPPVVSAGADMSTALPNATVSLSGSATDDGPAASLTYAWSSSDSAATSFSAATSAATDATFNAAGTYTLTLTVNDGTQSATDTLTVTVADAPPTADVFPADDVDDADPNHGWAKVDAATVGMTQGGLDTAATVAQTVPTGVNPGSGMIVRHGQLVHSWGDIDARKEMKSVTKSMGGITLGLAIDEGKLTLATKGIDIMPTFGTPPAGNATAAQTITIAQLATHTAGFEKQDGNFTAVLQFQPGTTWSYSDAGLNWLADVLTTSYQQDLSAIAQDRVWKVLGLNALGTNTDDVLWRTNAFRPATRDGGTVQYRELASGLEANVNAMARVGLLFLRKGMWKNQRVLSESFVQQVHTPLPENAGLTLNQPPGFLFPNATTDYGVLWWTNKSGQMANVPTDTYWAWGLGEELIVVIPSLDLVISRNSGQSPSDSSPNVRAWNDDKWDGDVTVLEPFLDPIVGATTP